MLSRNENDRESLWRFDPETGKSGKLSQIAEADSIQDAQWMDRTNCIYLGVSSGHKNLILADSSGTKKTSLLEPGNVDWFKVMPEDNQLLIGGAFNSEPCEAIWQFDLLSTRLRPLIPYSDHPSIYAKDVSPFYGSVELPSGRKLNYLLYMPAAFDRHKTYPLVIGCSPLWIINNCHNPGNRPWSPGMVASYGAFVVCVDRPGWYDGIEHWSENVMGVYQDLIQNACVDKNRVFLFGSSAETAFLSQLLEKSPGLWQGAILLNPGQLPDFSNGSRLFQHRPKILITAGSEEHEDAKFKEYQLDSLKSGVVVEFVIHEGEGHHLVGNAASLERNRALMRFIFQK